MPSSGPLKWHGGKAYLAAKIVALMPRHLHYVEPYAGGLAVLLERDPNDESLWLSPHKGVSEIANDINRNLTNFWTVLRHPDFFPQFQRLCQATPMGREVFDAASGNLKLPRLSLDNQVWSAWEFFVAARQSRAGTFKGFTQLTRNRLRRGINGNVSEWLGAVDGLAAVHARLQPVVLENMPALDLIRREDGPGTMFYLDPPYLHETRVSKAAYAYEMTEQDHGQLLGLINGCRGKVMLSGYRSALYDQALASWNRHDFDLANHAAGGKEKRRMTECLWCNF